MLYRIWKTNFVPSTVTEACQRKWSSPNGMQALVMDITRGTTTLTSYFYEFILKWPIISQFMHLFKGQWLCNCQWHDGHRSRASVAAPESFRLPLGVLAGPNFVPCWLSCWRKSDWIRSRTGHDDEPVRFQRIFSCYYNIALKVEALWTGPKLFS